MLKPSDGYSNRPPLSMRIMAMYFEQNVTSDRLEAFDGERFVAV
jgi:hypothetical protein